MKHALAITLLFAVDCAFAYYGGYQNVTSYSIRTSVRTPEGIAVDTSGRAVDLAMIDKETDEVERCLATAFPGGELPSMPAAHCLAVHYVPKLHRESFRVKIAPDSHVGCDGEQVFPCTIDPSLCAAKNLPVTAQCPCECRSTIQDNSVVVTTPNLHLYKAELIRLVTTCNNIWGSPQMSTCAKDENWNGSW